MRAALVGAVATCAFAFPAAALLAVAYRFPVPVGGYQSGVDAVPLVLAAVMFYGVTFGGFVLLAVLGAAAGAIAHRIRRAGDRPVMGLTLWLSLGVAGAASLTLALLDYLIGPW